MLLFLVDLINIEIFRISFSFFYLFSFILRSRATSVWYQNITSIRDQVITLLVLIRDQDLSAFFFVSKLLRSTKISSAAQKKNKNHQGLDHFRFELLLSSSNLLPTRRHHYSATLPLLLFRHRSSTKSVRPLFRRTFSPPFILTSTKSFPIFPLPSHLKVSTFLADEIRCRQSTNLDLKIDISKR